VAFVHEHEDFAHGQAGLPLQLRRSDLVALDCEDIEQCETGIKITIRHSKTDQEGEGAIIAIVRGSIACPVAALLAWRDAAGMTTGPLCRPFIARGLSHVSGEARSVHFQNDGREPSPLG